VVDIFFLLIEIGTKYCHEECVFPVERRDVGLKSRIKQRGKKGKNLKLQE